MAFTTILQARLMTSTMCMFQETRSFVCSPLVAVILVTLTSTTHPLIIATFILIGGSQLKLS